MGGTVRSFLVSPDTQPRVAVGTYVGTGSGSVDIVMAFQPDFVQVSIPDTGVKTYVFQRHRLNPTNYTLKIEGTPAVVAQASSAITSINSNGFTVGSSDGANVLNQTYSWIAIKGGG